MAKDKVVKGYEEHFDDLDFSEGMEMPGENLVEFMADIIEASNNQLSMAIELTKLIVEKSAENMNEEKVFSVFKQATQVISENMTLQKLWEKLPR